MRHEMEHFDPADPHGFGEAYHEEHHVSSKFILIFVLAILLFFTLLTVGQAVAEQQIASALDIVIPHWVNISIVMLIAVIKGSFVALYFMHLRHDNPLNGLIFIACLGTLGLFLGITMIDLGNRTTIYDWKDSAHIQGGTEVGIELGTVDSALNLTRTNTPIVEFARNRYIREHGVAHWWTQHPDSLQRWLENRAAAPGPAGYESYWKKWLRRHDAPADPAQAAAWIKEINPRAFFSAFRSIPAAYKTQQTDDLELLMGDIKDADWTDWIDVQGHDAWMHDPENHHPLVHAAHDQHEGSSPDRSRPQRWEAIEPYLEHDEDHHAPHDAHAPSHSPGHDNAQGSGH